MKSCVNCGSLIMDDGQFCDKCGAKQNEQFEQQPMQQPVQQTVYQQVIRVPQPQLPGKGMGVAAMVLGIISLVIFCFAYISLPCSILGVVLGAVSRSKAQKANMKNGMANAGVVCSCIALGLWLLLIVLALAGLASLGAALDTFV